MLYISYIWYIFTYNLKHKVMKITKKKLKELNKKLSGYSLELVADKYSKKLQCFCTTLKQDKEQLWNMNAINTEIRTAKVLTDITYLPYFK